VIFRKIKAQGTLISTEYFTSIIFNKKVYKKSSFIIYYMTNQKNLGSKYTQTRKSSYKYDIYLAGGGDRKNVKFTNC
jgi:hypothetical protein